MKQQQNECPYASSEVGVRRTLKDFRKLMNALDKTNFGCYVPHIPQIKATEDMP